MKLKFKNPITSSQRNLIKICNKHLKKKPLLKNKIKGFKNNAGRNNSGKITIRHKGGGHKQKYRIINFMRTTDDIGIVCSLEYDPNRNCNIASVFNYKNKQFFYILAPKTLKIGDIIKSGLNAEIKLGHALPLTKIPVGSFVHNIALNLTKPSQLTRSAGTFSIIKEKTLNSTIIELNSGEKKSVSSKCFATVGIVSNELQFLTRLSKAGHSRWQNKRPSVRGVAMNPIDHPHGGGEGKTSGLNKTPWGKPNNKGKIKKIIQ